MDDSSDAFQSPFPKIRSLSVRRKNTDGETVQKFHEPVGLVDKTKSSAKCDDTLYDVKDLDFDNDKENCKTSEKAKNDFIANQKDNILCDEPLPTVSNNEVKFPEYGFCSICNSNIPKVQCATHHKKCLNKKFASGHKPNVDLNNAVVCSTCGQDIKVIEFISHTEACKKSNIEAAKKLTNEVVTSSYFSTYENTCLENYSCPSCGKDLTILSTPKKTRHVNMCLDNTVHEHTTTTRSSSSMVCSKCGKNFRTSRGVKNHMRACAGGSNTTKPVRKRKVRAPRNEEEELIQLAKGISASSLAAEKQVDKNEKRRKRELPVPVMLQASDESRRADLRARLHSMVAEGDESDNQISSTPALPVARKWGRTENPPKILKEVEENSFTSLPPADARICSETVDNNNTEKEEDCAMPASNQSLTSKWRLGSNEADRSYKVHDLLTQFEHSRMSRERSQENDTEVASQEFSSTLHLLANLHRTHSPDASHDLASTEPEINDGISPYKATDLESVANDEITTRLDIRSMEEDFAKLRGNPRYSDLRLFFPDGEVFLHRVALLGRCPKLLEIFESSEQGNEVHFDQFSAGDFHPLLDYIYTNRCEDEELLQTAYHSFISSSKPREPGSRIELMEPESRDCMTESIIIAHDTPVTSSPSNNRDCEVMSDDDLFSSFTNKSRDRLEHIVSRSCDDDVVVDLTNSDVTDESKITAESPPINKTVSESKQAASNADLSDEVAELELSNIDQSASESSIIYQSERRISLSHGRASLSQPTPTSVKVSVDDVITSQPDLAHDDNDFSVNDSVLLQTALQFDPTTLKTPGGVSRKRVPITPMPNFSDMETPEIVNRGRKIGLKKSLGKKKMKIKLKELHAYTHQIEPEDHAEGGCVVEPSSSGPAQRSANGCDGEESTTKYEDSRKAIEWLEAMDDDEFHTIFNTALARLHYDAVLSKVLQREKELMKGIPSGSKRDLDIWYQRVTPGARLHRKEWIVLLGLRSTRQQTLVGILSSFIVEHPGLADLQPYFFNILPIVYRAVCRIDEHKRKH